MPEEMNFQQQDDASVRVTELLQEGWDDVEDRKKDTEYTVC